MSSGPSHEAARWSRLSSTARAAVAGALCAVAAAPGAVLAQGLVIEHDEIGCVVAEKHPRVVACFMPRSQLARARVYFRAGGTEPWYFVEMKSDAPCFSGILPKPKRTIPSVEYYVAATDRQLADSQTREFAPEVVPDEASCRKGLLAPFVDKASVVVGSAAGAALPAGFLAGAGVSTAAVVGVVGAGAAVAVVSPPAEAETSPTRPPRPQSRDRRPPPRRPRRSRSRRPLFRVRRARRPRRAPPPPRRRRCLGPRPRRPRCRGPPRRPRRRRRRCHPPRPCRRQRR